MLLRLLFGMDRVQSYTVHEGAAPPAGRIARAEALVFVKDGFTPAAFFGAPFWLAANQMWVWLAGYVAALAAAIGLVLVLELQLPFLALALVALHLLIGFEADDLKRGALEGQGFATLGAVTGKGALDCERRFLDIWLGGAQSDAGMAGQATAPAAMASAMAFAKPAAPLRPRVIGDLLGRR